MENRTLVLLTFILGTIVYSINEWYAVSSFYILILTVILLFYIIIGRKVLSSTRQSQYQSLLNTTLVFFAALAFTLNIVDINGHLSLAMWLNRFLLGMNCLLVLFYIIRLDFPYSEYLFRYKYKILLTSYLIIYLTLINIVRVPEVDVYQLLRFGPPLVLQGENPYVMKDNPEASAPKYSFYAYGPTTIYFFLPFDILFKEPRYLLILAVFITSIILYKMAKESGQPEETAQVLSLIYLSSPRLIHYVTVSLPDVLILALFIIGIWLIKHKKIIQAGLFMALIFGIKLPYVIPYIFLMRYKPFRSLKVVLAIILFLGLLYLPFAINNLAALYNSTLVLTTNSESALIMGRMSITFATFLERQFLYYPPNYFYPIAALFITLIIGVISKKSDNLAITMATVSCAFITYIFFGPLGMFYYYFAGISILFFSLATIDERSLRKSPEQIA